MLFFETAVSEMAVSNAKVIKMPEYQFVCLFANLSFFICFGGDCVSETTVSDSDFYLLLKFYEKSILLIFSLFLIFFAFSFSVSKFCRTFVPE